jgi:hypothetical protein
MTFQCILLIAIAFLVGVGGATVLWAACSVSGANAEDERPIDQ